MIRLKNIAVLLILLFISFGATTQDVTFSQFYANPLYLNPAFAGSVGVPRIAFQYRNQWQSFSNAFNSYSVAADFPVKKLNGGLGINFINDAQANGALNSYTISTVYAVHLRVSERFRFHGGLQAAYNRNSLKVNDLIFADNLDINFGNHGISGELNYITNPSYSYVDFSTGVLLYSEKVFWGVAVHHLSEPTQSFVSGINSDTKLNRKYTIHLGARLPVYLYGHNRKKFDISPQLIFQRQGEFEQINYGMFASKRGLAVGAWFRQNLGIRYDAIIFVAGFVRKRWQFTYSFDMTVSGLGGNSGGTSEVALVFLLRDNKRGKSLPFFDKYEEEFGEK